MFKDQIISRLKELTGHNSIIITTRGNAAIKAVLSAVKEKLLIPEEGGWLTYKKADNYSEVKCDDAVINLRDLEQKLQTKEYGAFLYQNPGGYFAEQPMVEIYALCRRFGCLVILDVSGSLGTELCDGRYADVSVGSFGEWKLVEAHVGGFISCKDSKLSEQLRPALLADEDSLKIILEKLEWLDKRILFLSEKRKKILKDLQDFKIVHPDDLGFVVVIKYGAEKEKEQILTYCQKEQLPWTECPRYIRLNKKAVSIEVKRLVG
ncbi:hypothetical protein COV20_01235 [Candidatus Woesearchaeota archaeon CG10_big_fil_rev_8_21_14_0_10_45_16]|nr:MAG: hypothetical protein COV20_01235 [Candidatus Woesearchaeota archaeon CG10_big_fil_rev_8_21_14_0_10_45_16]